MKYVLRKKDKSMFKFNINGFKINPYLNCKDNKKNDMNMNTNEEYNINNSLELNLNTKYQNKIYNNNKNLSFKGDLINANILKYKYNMLLQKNDVSYHIITEAIISISSCYIYII
jgi:hypothetical protein